MFKKLWFEFTIIALAIGFIIGGYFQDMRFKADLRSEKTYTIERIKDSIKQAEISAKTAIIDSIIVASTSKIEYLQKRNELLKIGIRKRVNIYIKDTILVDKVNQCDTIISEYESLVDSLDVECQAYDNKCYNQGLKIMYQDSLINHLSNKNNYYLDQLDKKVGELNKFKHFFLKLYWKK